MIGFSKKARIACAGLLFAIGYWPVFNYFVATSYSAAGLDVAVKKNQKAVVCCCDEFLLHNVEEATSLAASYGKLTTLPLPGDNLQSTAYDLTAISPLPLFAATNSTEDKNNNGQTAPKQNTTTVYFVKTIQNGEFVGAKVAAGKIKSNFYVDARNAGVPADVVDAVVKNLSSKVDFRRSLRSGDSFEIMYNQKNKLLYSKITTKRREFSVYGYSSGKGFAYFFANGEKVVQSPKASGGAFFGPPLLGKLSVS
ncbi:MAG: hypothetical protein LBT67_00490, partial [Holosporaceae bacterium]|nr:hypothetical protein [Holosporaceae bacterium]